MANEQLKQGKSDIKSINKSAKLEEVVKTEEEVKKPEIKAPKKTESSIYSTSLPISLKHSVGIGNFIKGKKINEAISDLQLVIKKKKAVPMTGEMAHKKGKRMATGKYPVKASGVFIKLLKSLSANFVSHGINLEKATILKVIPNKAPEQVHRFGRTKFKRTHIKIVAKENL